jgi:hypothetical protein
MTLSIKAPATFAGQVKIAILGGGKETLAVVYRHKTRAAMKEFIAGLGTRGDDDVLLEIVAGWEGLDAEFSADALHELIEQHPGAAAALLAGYFDAYAEARAGN